MPKRFFAAFPVVLACLLANSSSSAQDANTPFKVLHVKAHVVHGPILLHPTETSVTVMWTTDIACESKVEYGEGKLDHEAIPEVDGMVPVGTVQKVTISGLQPGRTYTYKTVSTPVVKLNAYWPDKGEPLESPANSFATFDPNSNHVDFSFITDTHENLSVLHALLGSIDWRKTDFLVHGGDPLNSVESESQMFSQWLDPIVETLHGSKPFVYAHGNHDTRGPFARNVAGYMKPQDGKFYFATQDGPVYLMDVDTGEDKPDSTNVYAHLNAMLPYREQEFEWFRQQASTDPQLSAAPFRVVVMHQPDWGWLDGRNGSWTKAANQAGVDLVVAGHLHHFAYVEAGKAGNTFPIVVVGQGQVAEVSATPATLSVKVTDMSGKVLLSTSFPRRSTHP